MTWVDISAVCLALALSSGAIVYINFMRARLERIEKWIGRYNYQQNIQALLGNQAAQTDYFLKQEKP